MQKTSLLCGFFFVILGCAQLANCQPPRLQLALDLYYNNPEAPMSSGSWELIALSDNRGLAGATILLEGIENVPVFEAPTGSSPSTNFVGFQRTYGGGSISFAIDRGSHWQIAFNQIPSTTSVQGLFYDVGVPGGATQPGEANTPLVPGLVGTNIPWNYNDLLGDLVEDGNPNNNNGTLNNGVLLARGHFEQDSIPRFFAQLSSSANVFTQVGTTSTAPPLDSIRAATLSTTVRDNQGVRPGDANLDGIVDALDFIVWNSNKFQDVPGWRNGDFNGDLRVDGSDFLIWNQNRQGANIHVSGSSVVPEPMSIGFGLLLMTIAGRCWKLLDHPSVV